MHLRFVYTTHRTYHGLGMFEYWVNTTLTTDRTGQLIHCLSFFTQCVLLLQLSLTLDKWLKLIAQGLPHSGSWPFSNYKSAITPSNCKPIDSYKHTMAITVNWLHIEDYSYTEYHHSCYKHVTFNHLKRIEKFTYNRNVASHFVITIYPIV